MSTIPQCDWLVCHKPMLYIYHNFSEINYPFEMAIPSIPSLYINSHPIDEARYHSAITQQFCAPRAVAIPSWAPPA